MKRNWEYKKLGDVCISELGKTLNQSKDTGSLRSYLCAVNVQWDSLDFTTLKQARFEEDELERYSVQKDDLLVCEGGDVGRAAVWNQEKPMLYQNALHRLRFSNNCNPRFYLFYLKHLKNKGVLDSRYAKGVTIKHLVKSSLLSIPIPVPPLSEQSRIVAELDLLTGIIDKQNAQLKELDTLAQSIFYDMFGDPIENPKGWDVKKLGAVVQDIFAGGDKPEDCADQPSEEYCYPVIANGAGDRGVLGYAKEYRVGADAVTIGARGASIGNCRICKACFTPVVRLITIIPGATFDIVYLFYAVQLLDFNINGAGQAQLTVPNVKSQNVVVPPLALQQSFADKIQSIENQKAKIKTSIAETQKLLDYTMDKYFG